MPLGPSTGHKGQRRKGWRPQRGDAGRKTYAEGPVLPKAA